MAQYDKVIPPGQEGTITLEIAGNRVHGTFNKRATVKTNDPEHAQMTIALAGKIISYVDIQPAPRVYLSGMYNEQVVKELTVTSNEKKKDFKIYGLSSNIDDKVTYKVIPENEPGRYKILVWKNPKLPTLQTWGSLFIDTNSEHAPRKTVQINVATRGAIICQPSQLNFGAVKVTAGDGNTKEKTLMVFKTKGDFTIENVEFTGPGYEAQVEPVEEGKKYRVIVSFLPESLKSNYRDEMIINTNDPQEPSIRVRLIARGI